MTKCRKIIAKYYKKYNYLYTPFWLISVAIFVFLSIYFSSSSYLIYGGEGNYYINLTETASLYQYSWNEKNFSTGASNPVLNYPFIIFGILALLQRINLRFSNLISIFFVYYLPFISMFVLTKRCFKLNLSSSIILSLFYVLNPFSSYYLWQLMFWNTSILFILPIYFILINQYFYDEKKLFIFFGITSLVLCAGFSNFPLFAVALMSIPFFLIINSFIISSRFESKKFFINIVITYISFFLFNFWWIQNIFFNFKNGGLLYSKDYAIGFLESGIRSNIFYKLFSLTWIIPDNPEYDFFGYFYNLKFLGIFLLIPFIFIIYYFSRFKKGSRSSTVLILFFLLLLPLTAGTSGPLSWMYIFFIKNIPFFSIFKTPWYKFGVLLIFLITITISLLVTYLNNKKRKFFYLLFGFYLIICVVPFLTGNFIPENKIAEDKYQSRKFVYKDEYKQTIEMINKDENIYRVLSLPGSLNYQVAMLNHENKYYTGLDIIMYALNKDVVAAYDTNNPLLFTKISDENWSKILSLYNIKKIIVNKDIYPWFGFNHEENKMELERVLDSKFMSSKNGRILIYDNNYFLPRIYTSDKPVVVRGNLDEMFDIATSPVVTISNNVFLLSDQLKEYYMDKYLKGVGNDIPTITFQKMNPTKYKIKIENAISPFFLIFSESYHIDWELYLDCKDFNFSEIIAEYDKIKVKETKHKMDFVISDIAYLFKKSIFGENHFKVNGYANAWYVDPSLLGKEDFTLTIYYKPQSYYYMGIIISMLTLLSCLIYVCYKYIKNLLN